MYNVFGGTLNLTQPNSTWYIRIPITETDVRVSQCFICIQFSDSTMLSVVLVYVCVFIIFVSIDSLPSISCVKFKNHLNMAVGTSTGQVNIVTCICSAKQVTRSEIFVFLSVCLSNKITRVRPILCRHPILSATAIPILGCTNFLYCKCDFVRGIGLCTLYMYAGYMHENTV